MKKNQQERGKLVPSKSTQKKKAREKARKERDGDRLKITRKKKHRREAAFEPVPAAPPTPGTVVAGAEFFQQRAKPVIDLDKPAARRALGLFVIRESDQWDLALFDSMREMTYQNSRHIPEVDAIRKVGLEPLRAASFEVSRDLPDGSVRRTTVVVLTETVDGSTVRAFLFMYGGYWHLWSRASAHKLEEDDADERHNAFTTILIRVIRRLRPVALYAAHLGRLVRSMSQGNRLQAALDGNVDHIFVKEMRFDLVGPQAQIGFMLLSMLSWVASMERDAIVTRLLTGRIAKWRRDEWPYGDATVPFGYKLRGKRLVPDKKLRPIVREMMLILIGDMGNAAKLQALSKAGVTTMRRHRRLGTRAPIGTLASADYAINTLMAWAPLWISGEYLWRVTNTFAGLEELSGVPIVRRALPDGRPDFTDHGEMQMLYRVRTPKGGWAEPEILAAFAEAAAEHSSRLLERGRTPQRPVCNDILLESADPLLLRSVLPADYAAGRDRTTVARRERARKRREISAFTGRNWTDGDHHYEIQMVANQRYRLVRWLLDEPTDEPGPASSDTRARVEAGR